MALLKVYISSVTDNGLYIALTEFPDAQVFHCADLSDGEIAKLHQKSLLSQKRRILFEIIPKAEQIEGLKAAKGADVVWVISPIRSPKTLKLLKQVTNVEEIPDLNRSGIRIKYIKDMVNRYGLPESLINSLLDTEITNLKILDAEAAKFALLLRHGKKIETDYTETNDSEIFTLAAAILAGDLAGAVRAGQKCRPGSILPLLALLEKKTAFLTFLALGDAEHAQGVLRCPPFRIREEKQLAGRLGVRRLANIYFILSERAEYFKQSQDQVGLKILKLFYYLNGMDSKNVTEN